MKRKFEQEFKRQAYNAVPDKWEEIKEKTDVTVPDKPIAKVIPFTAKRIASVAASVTVIIVAVSVAVGVAGRRNAPVKSEITEADETGVLYTQSEFYTQDEPSATASIDAPETTGVPYTEQNGDAHTTAVPQSTAGQTETGSTTVTVKAAETSTQTTAVQSSAAPSTTASNGQTKAAKGTPNFGYAAKVTYYGKFMSAGRDKSTMPAKFPVVQFDTTDLPDGLAKEYRFPFSGNESTTRPATLLYSGCTLHNPDPETDMDKTATADIYVFQNYGRAFVIGVKFPGAANIHPYVNMQYVPQTLGDFLNDADVKNAVRFGNIQLHEDGLFPVNAQNKADIFRYLLSDGSIKNTNAVNRPTGSKVTLNIDLAELGKSNRVMDVYESGYVYTNLTGSGCTFHVGKENVAAFLKNSYNTSFDELAKVNANTPGAASETTTAITHDPTVSQPFIPGTTAAAREPHAGE